MQGMLTCHMRHLSCLQASDTRQWNCKYIFYNPFLGCWESWNSLKFSGIQLQNDTVVLSVLSLHFSFNQWFNLFFPLKPSFPTTEVTARSDTVSIMLPITYLHTILQQRCLEHPAFGGSCNRIYPPKDKLDLYFADFTPQRCFGMLHIHSILIPFAPTLPVVEFVNPNLSLWDGEVILHLVWFSLALLRFIKFINCLQKH